MGIKVIDLVNNTVYRDVVEKREASRVLISTLCAPKLSLTVLVLI